MLLTCAHCIFREHKHIGASFTRFSFCKDIDTMREGAERLKKLKPYVISS